MKRKIVLLIWAAYSYSCLGQVFGGAPQSSPAGVGLSGGGAVGAVMPVPRAGNQSLSTTPEVRSTQRSNTSARYTLGGLAPSGSAYTQIPSLVLKFASEDEVSNNVMEEDLAIMTKIVENDLKKGVGEGGVEYKMDIPMIYTGSRSVRAMYMEGFGVLFMIKVNFPVYAPDSFEAKETPRQPELSEWETARRQLYALPTKDSSSASSRSKYKQAQVDTLKKLLIQTMRNATNIHNLQPEEWLSFSVFGHPVVVSKPNKLSGEKLRKLTKRAVTDEGEVTVQEAYQAANYQSSGQTQVSQNGTVLTLRAKRGDIEAFAAGKLGLDEFTKLVQTQSYFGNGYGVLSLNSWMMESSSIVK
jgi:hypothetical protein